MWTHSRSHCSSYDQRSVVLYKVHFLSVCHMWQASEAPFFPIIFFFFLSTANLCKLMTNITTKQLITLKNDLQNIIWINPSTVCVLLHAVQVLMLWIWPRVVPEHPDCEKWLIDRGRHLHSPEPHADQTNIQAVKHFKWLWMPHVGLGPPGAAGVNGLKQAHRGNCSVFL